MKNIRVFVGFLVLMNVLVAAIAQQCGPNDPCPDNMCCSQFGRCGCDSACGAGCQGQCNWCQGGGGGGDGGANDIGVNYGRVANNLPQPDQVVNLIKSLQFKRVKIFDTDRTVLRAFANSGIRLTVAVTNQEFSSIARSSNAASDWVRNRIAPIYPATNVEFIAVGNEVLSDPGLPWPDLVPSMWNLRNALNSLGFNQIKVTTPIATDILKESFPPSAGEFRSDNGRDSVVNSLLGFLSSTNSVFMANVYTFFAWQGNPRDISLEYALFQSNDVKVWDGGKGYTNLFDAMVDAIYSAMERKGYGNLPLAIGESGWPSGGAPGATVENAKAFNSRLIRRTRSGVGTPRKPGGLAAWVFALFNENQKGGPELERHFGLLYPNGSPVYPLQRPRHPIVREDAGNNSSSLLHSAA
ncbi:probable glucan endo-1,3-beta-glucosidase At4g16260 [Selaginella moellendorffii]|uniref:probable glucan endo-1,3-beta-glucosidase At4g16260 n=1 Tax=Selaginella moellendorffii TaxID=88036 RepID=UPI000D1D08DD|nr:probable glucan endo-1,3-beta-glucosidase At4g16260 [Selaginella moellendorffii]|eukprot:XP_002967643.2 probable glucan endo-1,3-beta-glucosidase At4g16260 [Selaginella moellendorffii]